MTNEELDDYMKTVKPNFDSHIEKETIEMSNEYYNLLEEKIARLINENQELKKQLENKYEKVGTLTGELLYEENTKLINQQKEVKEVIDRILNETKETRNILNNNRNNNMLSKSCLLSYLEIVEDLLKEVSE